MPKITAPATLENLEKLLESISRFGDSLGFSAKRVSEIKIAAEEALVNIFSYAYPDGIPGEVALNCRSEGRGAFVIELSDTGIPFDIRTLPDPDVEADISQRRIGGLGVLFIRKFANQIQYRREQDKNILTLTFNKS